MTTTHFIPFICRHSLVNLYLVYGPGLEDISGQLLTINPDFELSGNRQNSNNDNNNNKTLFPPFRNLIMSISKYMHTVKLY